MHVVLGEGIDPFPSLLSHFLGKYKQESEWKIKDDAWEGNRVEEEGKGRMHGCCVPLTLECMRVFFLSAIFNITFLKDKEELNEKSYEVDINFFHFDYCYIQ